MPDEPSLFETTPDVLVSTLQQLRQQRSGIENKERVIEQLLEMKADEGGEIADEIAALGASVAIGPLRNQIIQVLVAKQEEDMFVMVPKDVHDELVERGNRSVTLDNVRITMKRMAEQGELEREPPNSLVFGLPGALPDLAQKIQALNAINEGNTD
jgi:hypothetical protein